ARWFILDCIRQFVRDGKADGFKPLIINRFLRNLSSEHQLALLTDMVEKWGYLGADRAMFDLLRKAHEWCFANEAGSRNPLPYLKWVAPGPRAVAAPCRPCRRGACRSRRSRADNGRVRVRPVGCKSGLCGPALR